VWILLLALLIPLLSIAGLFVEIVPGETIGWVVAIAGWAIAIGGSVGLLAVFTVIDLKRRSNRWYVDQPVLLAALRVAVLVVGLVVAGFYAYRIADAVARLELWF
jgi:hypothetical protein